MQANEKESAEKNGRENTAEQHPAGANHAIERERNRESRGKRRETSDVLSTMAESFERTAQDLGKRY